MNNITRKIPRKKKKKKRTKHIHLDQYLEVVLDNLREVVLQLGASEVGEDLVPVGPLLSLVAP
jgi:hypothetical protein